MARSWFGGDSASFVYRPFRLGSALLPSLVSGNVEIWTDFADKGGVRITDLLDENLVPVSVIVADASGQVPSFQGPDGLNDRVLATTDKAVSGVWLLNTDGLPAAQARVEAEAARDAAQAAQAAAEAVGATTDAQVTALVPLSSGSQLSTELNARFVKGQKGRLRSAAVPDDGTDQTATIQGEIDTLAAAGGGEIELERGTFHISGLVMRSGVSLAGVSKQATVLQTLPSSSGSALVTLAPGPVYNAWLRHLSVLGNDFAVPGQHGIYLRAVGNGGTPNHGGWWNGGMEDVLVRYFAGDQIWLRGGGNDYLKPHQFLTFKDVEAYTAGLRPALRMTGQVGQVKFDGACEFDGPVQANLGGRNIVIAREVDDALNPVSDIAPYAINFNGTTSQNNDRGLHVERGHVINWRGGYFEGVSEAACATTVGTLVVTGSSFSNCGVKDGAGYCVKAESGSSVVAEDNLFLTPPDTHFVNSYSAFRQRNNVTPEGTGVTTTGFTDNQSVGADGVLTLGVFRSAIVNTSATPITTIVADAGTEETLSLKAWSGSIVLGAGGNIDPSGRVFPLTVPAGAVVTLVKHDLGSAWNIQSVSV